MKMFYFIYIIILHCTLTTLTTNVINYVEVPDYLQNRYGTNVQYDYYTNAEHEIYFDGKMITCRIGGYGSKELVDCFPFPEFATIPRHENKETAIMMCDHFAKSHTVYWFKESLVWCDIRPEAVRIRTVPTGYYSGKFGSTIYYENRTKAKFNIISIDEKMLDEFNIVVSKKITYKCQIGDFNLKNEMIDCFQFLRTKFIRRDKTKSKIKKRCSDYADKIFIYWFHGNIVWCDNEFTEVDVKEYRKGYYFLKIDQSLQKLYGETIYYDHTTNAEYQIESLKKKNGILHTCKIGCYVNKDFIVCFPHPKAATNPSNENKELVEEQCKSFAEIFTVYWEDSRPVWCESHGIIPNSSTSMQVTVINVPESLHDRFGKLVYYNNWTKAKYQIRLEHQKSANKYSNKGQKRYVCYIGGFSSSNNRTNEKFTDCFPNPGGSNLPKSTDENEIMKKCESFAEKYYVYWLNERVVWCDKDLVKFETVSYYRGMHLYNVPSQFSKIYGDNIFYDYTAPAVYEMIKDPQYPIHHTCKIGGFNNNHEFYTCFPVPKRIGIPKTLNLDDLAQDCEILAKNFILYWEGSRLVWCEELQTHKGKKRSLQ